MICPQCGEESGNTKYCIHCGAAIGTPATTAAEVGPQPAASQPAPADVAPKKRRSIKKILLIVISIFVVAGAAAYFILSRAADSDTYDIGKDTIPSMKAIVGHRDIGEVSASIENGVTTKTYVYKNIQNPQEDLDKYIAYMRSHGFALTEDMDLNETSGSTQLGKESAEKGKIILMDLKWAKDNYEVKIQLGEGTFTRN